MTSDTSQAKSVVLIQWGLVTGSGSISRSAYLCLNHFFLNYQHLPGFPQALYLCLGSLFHIYQWIRHRKNRQQLSRGWKHHYKSHFYKYWCTVVFTWAGGETGVWHLDMNTWFFTVRRCGPTTLGAIKSSQHMAVKTKLICVAHANGHL